MGLPLDWRSDPIVQIENVMLPVLTGTCAAILQAGGDAPTRVQWQRDVDELSKLLRTGADEWLGAAGFPFGDEGRARCDAAADNLSELSALVAGTTAPDATTQAITYFQTECQPALLDALDAIRAVFIGGVLARQAQHAANTERALHELGTISKTILFISINASIEAGRAGDAGRSFSVIADDIRSLAQNAQHTIASIKAG